MPVGDSTSERRPVVLFIGAHADDVELGCGATIHKYRHKWHCVTAHATRSPRNWTYPNDPWPEPSVNWSSPVHQALGSVGAGESRALVDPFWVEALNGHKSTLSARAYNVRGFLQSLQKHYSPALVFLIDRDRHPDHQLVYDIGKYMFDDVIVFRPHRLEPFEPNFYVPIEQEDLEAKVQVVNLYKDLYLSVQQAEAPYFSEEVVRACAVMDAYPVRPRTTLAEAFRVDKLSPSAACIF